MMNITQTPTSTTTPTPPTILTTSSTTTLTKSPEHHHHETETPPKITIPTTTTTTPKILSFSNGFLKRNNPNLNNHHHHLNNHHNNHHQQPTITYRECLKNHAANLGGHALDGCGEFMTSPTATTTDPTSLKCAACGCHRNFHRREPEESLISPITTTHVIEYQPHHRHQPLPPPPFSNRSPNSSSPPPISSSYYPSAPHMLLALSSALPENTAPPTNMIISPGSSNSRKRFRTKFSQEQKEKMLKFAEKVGWKMQRKDDDLVNEFCNEICVDRSVLKVWMHNNKNTFAKRENVNINNDANNNNDEICVKNESGVNGYQNVDGGVVGVSVRANGGSSSS